VITLARRLCAVRARILGVTIQPVSRRATARDVAERAGCSSAAVSLLVNGKDAGRVSPQLRSLVYAAAEEVGYRVNTTASALVRGRLRQALDVTNRKSFSPPGGFSFHDRASAPTAGSRAGSDQILGIVGDSATSLRMCVVTLAKRSSHG
jgi:hypothetical protein